MIKIHHFVIQLEGVVNLFISVLKSLSFRKIILFYKYRYIKMIFVHKKSEISTFDTCF